MFVKKMHFFVYFITFLYVSGMCWCANKTVRQKRIVSSSNVACDKDSIVAVVSLTATASNQGSPRFQGGAVLTPLFVITADYFEDEEYEKTVYVISHPDVEARKPLKLMGGDWRVVSKWYRPREHHEYPKSRYRYTKQKVVILELRNPLSSNMRQVMLPRLQNSPNCRTATTAGWGLTQAPGTDDTKSHIDQLPDKWKCAYVTLSDTFSECSDAFDGLDKFSEHFLCEIGTPSKCFMDAGNPIFCGRTLIGITHGYHMEHYCGSSETPTIHYRIDSPVISYFIYKVTGRKCVFLPTMSHTLPNLKQTKRPPKTTASIHDDGMGGGGHKKLPEDAFEMQYASESSLDDYWHIDLNMSVEHSGSPHVVHRSSTVSYTATVALVVGFLILAH